MRACLARRCGGLRMVSQDRRASMMPNNVLSTVDLGDDKTLLMNRTNGKWAIVPSTTARCLDEPIADGDDKRREALLSELRRRALFDPPYAPPQHLNTLIL